MLTHWDKLLNTDCTVVNVGEHTVYPIFRNGYSSLMSVANRTYVNEKIADCKHIDILIRDPGDRFISGLNEYCNRNTLDVKQTWQLVEQDKLVDRHFAPQYMWLFHLYKFYKGTVTLKPFSFIKKITKTHINKYRTEKVPVALLKSFVDVDYELIKNYNDSMELGELIKRYRNVLS